MNLLIPHGRDSDQYLVAAAQKLGGKVHFMCNMQEPERLDEVRAVCKPDVWVPLGTRFDLKLSNEDYLDWYHNIMVEYVRDNQIHAILPCSSMDIIMEQVAMVNELFELPGIKTDRARLFSDKAEYLPVLEAAGVPVAKIHEIVEPGDEPRNLDLRYPVVAKPGLGSGGYGIFIADDADRLRWFFGPSDNPTGFSERALFYQDRDFAGQPKSYLHFGMGGRYIVQEYLPGPCISLAGTARGGVLELDLAYDIGVTSPPHCSEINFGWPSIYEGVQDAAARCCANLAQALTFPDGAWMADTIFCDGELHVVDLAPRMSSSGTKMLYHTCGNIPPYAANVITSLVFADKDFKVKPTVPTFYSFLPFPKGKLTNVRYPSEAELTECETPIQGEGRVFEMRNDVQVADRGWVVGQGRFCRKMVEEFIEGIKYDLG